MLEREIYPVLFSGPEVPLMCRLSDRSHAEAHMELVLPCLLTESAGSQGHGVSSMPVLCAQGPHALVNALHLKEVEKKEC